ncbi:unnamed protein product, partial [Prunus brigantina]
VANLTAWCSGPKGCARTRDVLLLDTVRFVRWRRGFDRVWVRDDDILMNGFFLQSTTTPRKACKGIESALQKNKLLRGRLLVLSDWGKQVVQSAFGIVKYGGVTPINLGKSRPPP